MYFSRDRRHAANTALVRPSPIAHQDRADVERAPLVRSSPGTRGDKSFATVSVPNDKPSPMDIAVSSNPDRHHAYYYAAVSSPCSSPPVTSASTVHPTSIIRSEAVEAASHGRSTLEYYTQTLLLSGACQIIQKRCTVVGCSKTSVSRGLCRSHGGGRRCHFKSGCTKSAQSRSMFCWAHGGGQRCDVPQCMRSRKSKRFCGAHLHLDQTASSPDQGVPDQPRRIRTKEPRARTPLRFVGGDSEDSEQQRRVPRVGTSVEPRRRLPSLRQALTDASRTLPNLPRRTPREFCT